MIEKQGACDPMLLNRYFDGEVGRDEQARIEAHLSVCAACRSQLQRNRVIGAQMRMVAEQRLAAVEKTYLENRLLEQAGERRFRRRGGAKWLLRFRWLIPAGAAMGALLLLSTLFTGSDSTNGPSAIVTSFQGDYSSLMIVETPGTRSTIIWFDEAS